MEPLRAPAAVLFDVGGTLLREARFDLESGFGAVVPGAPERARELAGAFFAEMLEVRRVGRELPVARWLRARLAGDGDGDGTRLGEDDIEDRICGAAVGLDPAPGVERVLARLAADGVRMAAVSNSIFTARALAAELARHGLAEPLAFVLSSADHGLRKPAAAIFEAALARLGARAAETWFVGDTFADDIVGAARAGLTPVWLSAGDTAGDAPEAAQAPPVTRVRSWPDFLDVYEAR